MLAACKRTPPSDARPAASSPEARPAPSASIALESEPPRPPVSGCFDSAGPLPDEPSAALERLVAACAPGNHALGKAPRALKLATGAPQGITVNVPALACVRVIAVAAPTVRELDVVLTDDGGRELGHDLLPGRFALVGERGPVCVRDGGTLKVRVTASIGTGPAAVRVLQAD